MEPKAPALPQRRRPRKTRRAVRIMDVVSRLGITFAGIGTIVAVFLVFVFLLIKIVPLFLPASIEQEHDLNPPANLAPKGQVPVAGATDEDQLLAWVLSREGNVAVFRLDNGETLDSKELFRGATATAVSSPGIRSFNDEGGLKVLQHVVAFGFPDGTIRAGTIRLKSTYPSGDDVPAEARGLKKGEAVRVGKALVRLSISGQYNRQEVVVDLPEAPKPAARSPIRLVDQTQSPSGPVSCSLSDDGKLRFNRIRETVPLDPELPIIRKLVAYVLPYNPAERKSPPDHLLLSENADQLFLIWNDGVFHRYDLRDPRKPQVAERSSFFPIGGRSITAIRPMLGRSTILVGDSAGTVGAWFLVKPQHADTIDGARMVRGHEIKGPEGQGVAWIDVSTRDRNAAITYSGGTIRLYNITSEKRLAEMSLGREGGFALLAPRVDGVLGICPEGGKLWRIDRGHPEISLGSVFCKVWYEGSPEPVHKWESSSGHDAYEPKMGLMPIIFGTMKATLYSLLFGVPLALLAAIYTSEFMRPRARAVVKPVIEMMASLPSVVLGFMAGLVIAQFVEDKVVPVLCCVLFVPLAFGLAGQVVQTLPEKYSLSINRVRFLCFIPALVVGVLVAFLVGPLVEKVFFGGDLRHWLNDHEASSLGGWMLLFLPLSLLITVFLMGGAVSPRLRRLTARWDRSRSTLLDLFRYVVGCLFAFGLSLACSALMSWLHHDPRGSYIGTYDQRNMLVTGFAIGFAIVPIIYTLADDALTAVPQHLRFGSLATGATPWQTAIRIVIPTAMGGLFSAVMIGMGRAVGETMILVMASGDVAVMDWNVFNGCRTLAANIAVEIAESEVDGTLYRLLFFSALILFMMTFTLNTIAEFVRQRFSKRSYHL